MKFEWEKIGGSNLVGGTWRVKVIGGWLINNLSIIETDSSATQRMATESMVFVADPNHKWVIDESPK